MSVGVLALQGDFAAHGAALSRAGAAWHEARTAEEILRGSALVIPGGESTTFWRLMEGTGVTGAIREIARRGDPVFGTCAGAILLSSTILHPAGEGLGLLDATVVRNAYGRQLDSAVVRLTDLDREALGDEPLEAVFIRAPRFSAVGGAVRVLARRDGDPVLVRQGNLLAATFHPELADDMRVVDLFLAPLRAATEAR
ncbi:MAG TPA: pyridoxal 5'-phosphate synthase glutaminase subunit PdxT [Thermoanaerobaculia bacterium]|nr:pyridoxal 5'-phosphate synthase glutaminase subunit PdxT [Thermoanaerobaculia bacterium]